VGNENEGYILSIGQYTGKKYFQYRTFYRVFEFIRQIQGIIRC
jgi:hypothetical protein